MLLPGSNKEDVMKRGMRRAWRADIKRRKVAKMAEGNVYRPHTEETENLKDLINAAKHMGYGSPGGHYGSEDRYVVMQEAALVLLETHDATGINLTKFGAVETFVNDILSDTDMGPVRDNGV